MATRSTISLKTESGYSTIYCHWDGYPSHTGRLLKEHYDTQEKAEELIKLGSLSYLRKFVKPGDGVSHTFDEPATDVTVAYCRDRMEGVVPHISGYEDINSVYQDGEEYNYVFEDGKWWLVTKENNAICLEPVRKVKPFASAAE
jgi:hypothetical protein